MRNLVKAAFTPQAIARWRPIAERVTNELCDRIEADGQAELVEQYNYELPFNVIAHILGIPEDDFPHVKALAWDFARAGEKTVSPRRRRAGATTRPARSSRYFGELAEQRRSAPGDDLLSSLLEAEADGERLTAHRARRQLHPAAAGRPRDHPGPARQRRRSPCSATPTSSRCCATHPELTKNAVEEFLRYDGSVQINHRVVLDGMTVGDTEIAAGEMVYIFLGAVNRDPERFPEPDRLDITRDLTHHLAFSFGAYYCLGRRTGPHRGRGRDPHAARPLPGSPPRDGRVRVARHAAAAGPAIARRHLVTTAASHWAR